MAVKLRLRRMGRKKLPIFSLVAADGRSPRDGRYIEDLGRYEPLAEPSSVNFNQDRVLYWLQQGAQPSHTVRNLLSEEGIMLRLHMLRKGKSEEEIEQAVAEFLAYRASKVETGKSKAELRKERLEAERAEAAEKAKEIAAAQAAREAELEAQRQEAEAEERAKREAEDAAPEGAEAAEATEEAPADAAVEESPEAVAEEPVAEEQAAEAEASDETPVEEVAEAAAEEVEEPATETVQEEEKQAAEEPAEEAAEEVEADAEDAPVVAEEAQSVIAEAEAVDPEPIPETTEAASEMVGEGAPVLPDEAEEPSETAAVEPDDLTKIWGIGPKFAALLNEKGVNTFAQLASIDLETLRSYISESGASAGVASEEVWAKQAEFAAAGDWDGLKAYVEEQKKG